MKPERLIEKWRNKLFLSEWSFDIEYAKEDQDENGYDVPAEINANPVYKIAHITIFPCFFKKPKESQEHSIIHEMCHCITQEPWEAMHSMLGGKLITSKQQREIIERMTQKIANVIYYGVR